MNPHCKVAWYEYGLFLLTKNTLLTVIISCIHVPVSKLSYLIFFFFRLFRNCVHFKDYGKKETQSRSNKKLVQLQYQNLHRVSKAKQRQATVIVMMMMTIMRQVHGVYVMDITRYSNRRHCKFLFRSRKWSCTLRTHQDCCSRSAGVWLMFSARGLAIIWSFHRRAKLFELNFFIYKKNAFCYMIKPAGQTALTAGQFAQCLAVNETPASVLGMIFKP